jgi:hypothetical protein
MLDILEGVPVNDWLINVGYELLLLGLAPLEAIYAVNCLGILVFDAHLVGRVFNGLVLLQELY